VRCSLQLGLKFTKVFSHRIRNHAIDGVLLLNSPPYYSDHQNGLTLVITVEYLVNNFTLVLLHRCYVGNIFIWGGMSKWLCVVSKLLGLYLWLRLWTDLWENWNRSGRMIDIKVFQHLILINQELARQRFRIRPNHVLVKWGKTWLLSQLSLSWPHHQKKAGEEANSHEFNIAAQITNSLPPFVWNILTVPLTIPAFMLPGAVDHQHGMPGGCYSLSE
jgi:hypothetical protein